MNQNKQLLIDAIKDAESVLNFEGAREQIKLNWKGFHRATMAEVILEWLENTGHEIVKKK